MRPLLKLSIGGFGLVAAVTTVCIFESACRTAAPSVRAESRAMKYHCPMHPTYLSDKPGDCPICGMKLVPTESPNTSPAAAHAPSHEGHGTPKVPDRVEVALTAERRRLLGVRSEPVTFAEAEAAIRTVGRITVDERRIHHVHTKYEGYVEKLFVDFTGKYVRRGEPLATIYSPELVATQEEYLLALRAQERLGSSQVASVAKGGADLLEAARRRLLLLDISPATIERLERTSRVQRSLELYSPVSGYVIQRGAVQGTRVMPSDSLFDIADLSHLWVMADVYEQDLAAVRLGTPAALSVTYLSGEKWTGTVTWIAPMVEEKTRTVKVRIEVDNSGERLKPEMFADVALRVAAAERSVVVPEGALIRSGERNLVFVDDGDGHFSPREVEVGRKGAVGVEIKHGLAQGERVVTSANFLLDSESSLKAAVAAMSIPPGAESAGTGTIPAPVHQH